MTDLDVRAAMSAVAAEAPDPPADLLGRVEAGRRRHRRNQVVVAAFAAVLVLAAGSWAAIRPATDRADTPVAPPPAFIIPPAGQSPPPLTTTWPGALLGPDGSTRLDGLRLHVLRRLDDRHLLMGDENLAKFYSYDAKARTFRVLVSDTGGQAYISHNLVAQTPHWIVWVGGIAGGVNAGSKNPIRSFSIFRAPITGGERELVGVVPADPSRMTMYATDEHVYWGRWDGSGLTRLSMADGKFAPLPGFDSLVLNGAGWAESKERFRNVVTGEERRITPSPDAKFAKCELTFCLVQTAAGWFLQRLDGSDRSALPWKGTFDAAGGMVMLPDNSLLDPFTGKRGIAHPSNEKICVRVFAAAYEQVFYRWGCKGRDQVVYLTPAD